MTMFTILVLATALLQTSPSVTLPATPQGRQIEAFVKALRSGEAAFVKCNFQDPERAVGVCGHDHRGRGSSGGVEATFTLNQMPA